MRIKLIAPHDQNGSTISSASTFAIRKVNLPLLAALTPPQHTVAIVDEAFAPDNTGEDVDLVGITVMTDLVVRAYQIADNYRARGVKVVMGGIHPTVLPGEALEHADAVVAGEAETVWGKLLSDAAAGKLQQIYRTNAPADLACRPLARLDLYPKYTHRSYTPLATGVEAARGCPYDCEFCSIGAVMGRRYRPRPTPEVIHEIAAAGSEHVFFVDDALAIDRPAAKRLFAEMTPMGLKWAGQGTITLASDPDLLRLMKRSGCVGLLVGFESVQPDPSGGMKKLTSLRVGFTEAVRRFHDQGITVVGAFVFGFDHENADVFAQTHEFIVKNRLDAAQLRILTPLPGTRLYARLLQTGRLFAPDWWLRGYPADTLLYQPRSMAPEQLVDGFAQLNRQVCSFGSILKRFWGVNPLRRGGFGCSVYAGFNLATRERYLQGLSIPQPFVDRRVPAEKPIAPQTAWVRD